jgi:hypothetical protein
MDCVGFGRVRAVLAAAWFGVLFGALIPRPAAACGGGGVTSQSSGVVANAQRIVMSVRAATTDVVVQIGVPATTADYGVLIPTDTQPTLDPQPVSEQDLAALDAATAPNVFVHQGSDSSGDGCGCLGTAARNNAGGAPPGDGGVSVSAPVGIGPVEAVVLTGDTGDAVNGWLAANNFALSADGQAIVAAYAATGRYFIAIRRSDSATSGAATSIGVHYTLQGAHQKLSLGFSRLGAAPTVSFTLFNATATRTGPLAPYAALRLNDLDQANLRAGHYADAVAAAVAAHGNQAFVLEDETSKASLAARQVGQSLLGLIDDGATIVRMSTVVAAGSLSGDAFFGAYDGGPINNTVYAQNETPAIAYASAGFLPVMVLAGLRRRRRRAPRPRGS